MSKAQRKFKRRKPLPVTTRTELVYQIRNCTTLTVEQIKMLLEIYLQGPAELNKGARTNG